MSDFQLANDDDLDLEIPSPTEATYTSFYAAFAFFNDTLFKGELPEALITMQRSKRSRGYFSSEQFGQRRGTEVVDLSTRCICGNSISASPAGVAITTKNGPRK